MQKPDSTCRQGWDTNPRPAELASQPGSLHCSSESVSPLSHEGRSESAQFPSVSFFSAETTGPIFTRILHDIVALVMLFNHAYTRRYPIFTARRLAKRAICRRRVSVCVSVCLSVCLSHSGIVSKRLNVGSRKQRRTIAP